MSVLTYAVLIEVAPGVLRPAIACTPANLAQARALEARREGLQVEIQHLIEEAYQYDLPVPQELRDMIVEEWDGRDVPRLEALRDALRDRLAAQPV